MSLFAELRRRNVLRVAIAYVVVAWLVIQVADVMIDNIGAPGWVFATILMVLAIGFPVALVFAWAFELTPEGIKREHEVDRSASIAPRTGRKLDRLIIGVLAVAVVYLLVDKLGIPGTESTPEKGSDPISQSAAAEKGSDPISQSTAANSAEVASGKLDPTPFPGPGVKSIAVLPFVNMSADADNEYFSDGISEEILNVLASVPELKVTARTSAFAFKGSKLKISEIARELGVNHILEGSVRKSGDQVRVTAQLIKADDEFHLWSESYDRKLDNIFAIQDEIANAIADQLKVSLELTDDATGNLTGTQNLAAYEHYLQGMQQWHMRTAQSLYSAIDEFEQAIALDPQFAKAHAGLALAWGVIAGYVNLDEQETLDKSEQAANRALALNPESVEAQVSLGTVYRLRQEFGRARELFEQVIANNPSYATAHQWYAGLLADMGDPQAALAEFRIAWSLDPRARIIGYNLAWQLLGLGRLDEAIAVTKDVLDFAPEFPDGLGSMTHFQLLAGDCEQMETFARRTMQVLGKTHDIVTVYRDLCQSDDVGKRQQAVATILSWQELDFSNPEHPSLSYEIDLVHVFLAFGLDEATWALIDGSRLQKSLIVAMRGNRTPQGVRFQCQARFVELEKQFSVPPSVKPLDCP